MLRAKVVEKHGSEECAAKARQKLAEEGGQTAFSVMMRAQLIHKPTSRGILLERQHGAGQLFGAPGS